MKNCHSIYVHIPFCKARCAYCAFSSCTDFSLTDKYFEKLNREVQMAADGSEIVTMFWGGGTPSVVPIEHLRGLFDTLKKSFNLTALQEFTLECNPESVTDELLDFFKEIGVNRLSFGLQSVNDSTLKKIGRLHSYQGFLHALELARVHGFTNVNADLIVGLPETMQEFFHTVEEVCKLPLTHVSLYALELHDNEAFNRLCETYNHTDDQLADAYDFARQKFAEAGLLRYEVSNFARDGFACRHNLTYWTENEYYGFGAAACGFVNGIRYGNFFDIRRYCEEENPSEYAEAVDLHEQACECVMVGLRLQQGIDLEVFRHRFGIDFFQKFPDADNFLSNGFLQVENGRIFVPDDKFYVLNSILVELLPD